MIKELTNFLLDNKVNSFVTADKQTYDILTEQKIESVKLVNDDRSASFYVFGKSVRENKTVVLFINGAYIPNIYTSLTEAWFQKTKIMVIALYKDYEEINCDYLNRCIEKKVLLRNIDEIESKIKTLLPMQGPSLVNLVTDEIKEKKYDYSDLLSEIEGSMDDSTHVICFNSKQLNRKYKLNVNNISSQYKYGLFSKYLGYMVNENNVTILCCPLECILVDLNIFNNRYINQFMKIIIVDRNEIIVKKRIDKWLESNGIRCKELNKKELDNLYTCKEPTVLISKEELK